MIYKYRRFGDLDGVESSLEPAELQKLIDKAMEKKTYIYNLRDLIHML